MGGPAAGRAWTGLHQELAVATQPTAALRSHHPRCALVGGRLPSACITGHISRDDSQDALCVATKPPAATSLYCSLVFPERNWGHRGG